MKFLTKKLLAFGLSVAIVLSCSLITSFADTTTETDITISEDTVVSKIVPLANEELLVSIPNKLVLGNIENTNKYSADYIVSVDGDFAENKTVSVNPSEIFELSQSGISKSTTAYVTQDKTEFTNEDIINDTNVVNGSVETENLTAGSWNGQMNFNISVDTFYGTEIASWDVSETAKDSVTMTYYANDTTVATMDEEATYQGGTLVFSGTGNMLGSYTSAFNLTSLLKTGNFVGERLGTYIYDADNNPIDINFQYQPKK